MMKSSENNKIDKAKRSKEPKKKKRPKSTESAEQSQEIGSGSSSSGGGHRRQSEASNKIRSQEAPSVQSLGMYKRVGSITSLASQYSLATGQFTPSNVKLNDILSANSGHINEYGHSLYDSALIYLTCPRHKKIALSKVVKRGLFLPYGPIKTGESWLSAAAVIVQKILNAKGISDKKLFTEPLVLDILRIQTPTYFEFVNRITYQCQLTEDACKSNYCTDNDLIAWFRKDEVNGKVFSSDYLGPEPSLFQEVAVLGCREVMVLDVLLYSITTEKRPEAELLATAGYKESDVIKIYGDFLQHTFPSECMTFYSFKNYVDKSQLPFAGDTLKQLFRSFLVHQTKFINFHEFLLGLAFVDWTLGKIDKYINRMMSDYLFRYFFRDKLTTEAEVSAMHAALKVDGGGGGNSAAKWTKRLANCTAESFHKVINELVVPGSVLKLFPLTSSPITCLRAKTCYPGLNLRQITLSDNKTAIQAKLQRMKELCANCRNKQYTLSTHLCKMSQEGQIYEPVPNKQADSSKMPQHRRLLSERYFTKSFVCNQLIDIVRAFAFKNKLCKSKFLINAQDWDSESVRMGCVDKILKICSEAKSLFMNTSRVIKITSSCYVIGDLHGNLHDLLIYEKTIWKLGPYFNSSNFLFLGDYVDRGDYSVEVVLYLICLKLLVPDRIFMLRGNHECRSLQKEFTFYTECLHKFGDRGEEVWEAFNNVFDVLPLCAVIDESIFCAHGGPFSALKIEQAMAIKSPLREPETESDIALEILWNDPVTNQEYQDLLKNDKAIGATFPDGFLANIKRGTACYYSETALDNFLIANSLTHVIRAHEVIPSGFQYHMGGKCVTVFSCSRYCGGINEAAVAFVNDSKIRVIKVDT